MTAEERREGGMRLCGRLCEDVHKLVPEGIGSWAMVWNIVADADSAFMIALTRWEATGSEEDKPPLRAAYFAVLDAWRRAVQEYEREGASR